MKGHVVSIGPRRGNPDSTESTDYLNAVAEIASRNAPPSVKARLAKSHLVREQVSLVGASLSVFSCLRPKEVMA